MKIRFLIILFIAFMVLSCKEKKKTNLTEQDLSAPEIIETSEEEDYYYFDEQEETTGIIKFDDVKNNLYVRMEDITKTLRVWTRADRYPFNENSIDTIIYGKGRFVAECSYFQGYNSTIFFSDNGFDWNVVKEGPVDPVYNIFCGNGIFISVSHSARMSYSIDGETWYPESNGYSLTIRALDRPGANLGGIAYGKGRFVIGCGNGTRGCSGIALCDMPKIDTDITLDALPEDDS